MYHSVLHRFSVLHNFTVNYRVSQSIKVHETVSRCISESAQWLSATTHLKLSLSCRFSTRLSALRYTLFWDCATWRRVKHRRHNNIRKQRIGSHDLSARTAFQNQKADCNKSTSLWGEMAGVRSPQTFHACIWGHLVDRLSTLPFAALQGMIRRVLRCKVWSNHSLIWSNHLYSKFIFEDEMRLLTQHVCRSDVRWCCSLMAAWQCYNLVLLLTLQ